MREEWGGEGGMGRNETVREEWDGEGGMGR